MADITYLIPFTLSKCTQVISHLAISILGISFCLSNFISPNFEYVPIFFIVPSLNCPTQFSQRPFQLPSCTVFLICLHITQISFISGHYLFRYILQMYQGVFTQYRGVAHNSRFSDFSSISRIISFHFSVFCAYGAFCHPNSCAIWGIYHPIYFQLFAALYEAFTIPYIFNGAFILPILGCFCCTLHLPSL